MCKLSTDSIKNMREKKNRSKISILPDFQYCLKKMEVPEEADSFQFLLYCRVLLPIERTIIHLLQWG